MTDLSPAAQAVLDAFWRQPGDRSAIAAALRAAVDQIQTNSNRKRHYAATASEMLVLYKILVIADELENAND